MSKNRLNNIPCPSLFQSSLATCVHSWVHGSGSASRQIADSFILVSFICSHSFMDCLICAQVLQWLHSWVTISYYQVFPDLTELNSLIYKLVKIIPTLWSYYGIKGSNICKISHNILPRKSLSK